MRTNQTALTTSARTIAGLVVCAGMAFCGCEKKEKVLDVDTPGGGVEIERSTDNGNVDVEVNKE